MFINFLCFVFSFFRFYTPGALLLPAFNFIFDTIVKREEEEYNIDQGTGVPTNIINYILKEEEKGKEKEKEEQQDNNEYELVQEYH